MLARRFLGCIFVLTLLVVAGSFLFYQFGQDWLTRFATPTGHYEEPAKGSGPDYSDQASWAARPGVGANLTNWIPEGAITKEATARTAATFFIHPTTYLERDSWNAPLRPGGDAENRVGLFVQSQASAFASVSDIWAPRYRQAAYGAFLLKSEDATKAINLAYRDVLAAFDAFLSEQPAERPLILAGHSQGSLHLSRLLVERKEQIAGRLVAAYVAGWPVGAQSDLPAMSLSACQSPTQSGCLLSWQSFSEPANVAPVLKAWEGTEGLAGEERDRREMVCVNPLTGTANTSANRGANDGTIVPNGDFSGGRLVPQRVGATCRQGFLMLEGEIPDLGPYVLPGNNYHVYDYALFWADIREDAERRLRSWTSAR